MRYFPEKRPTVKIYLHQYGKKELEAYSVYARVLYKRKKFEFSLRMKVSPDNWDFENNLFIPNRQYNIHCNQTLNKHLRTMKIMAGIKNQISCHVGRHTFAVQSLDAGISIEVLQRLLGHKSISSTMIYAQISHRKLSESILLLN